MMSERENTNERTREQPNIKGDRMNIAILIFMYMIQGAMFGLTEAFPIIFQNRKVSYADQVRILSLHTS